MRAKSLLYQYVKVSKVFPAALGMLVFLLASAAFAQMQKPSLPDPIKFLNKRDVVMRMSRAVLEEMGYRIELEDPQAGRLVTRPHEFVSGALTSTEIDKIAAKNDTITGTWIKANYTVEATFEIISPTETMVTISTQMQGLNRDINGTEKWIPVQSLGSVEKRILSKISMKLLGFEPEFKEKKGFWDMKPTPPIKKEPAI